MGGSVIDKEQMTMSVVRPANQQHRRPYLPVAAVVVVLGLAASGCPGGGVEDEAIPPPHPGEIPDQRSRESFEAEIAALKYQTENEGKLPTRWKIINAHDHILEEKHLPKYLAAAERVGIEQTVFVASPHFTVRGKGEKDKGMRENFDAINRMAEQHPGKIIPFTTVSPGWTEPLAALKEDYEKGARGLKLYNGHSGFYVEPLTDPKMMKVYAWCEEKRFPLMWHVRIPLYLAEFEEVMRKHPKLNVVVAHYAVVFWQPTEENLATLRRLLDTYENLRFDTSLGTRDILINGLRTMAEHRDTWRKLIMDYPDRFVMGTDMVVTGNREKTPGWIVKVMMASRDQLEKDIFYTELAAGYSRYGDRGDPSGRIEGLGLPDDVLKKIYEDNPKQWLGDGAADTETSKPAP